MAHDVYISFSTSDKPIADGICAHLESAGVRCWIAPRDTVPGEDWPTAIAQAIAASRVMVLVFSQTSNRSEDVSRELYLAANNKVIIVPFKIEDVQPEAGKAYYLGRTHWLDAMNPPTLEQIGQLIERVKSILSAGVDRQPATPVSPAQKIRPPAFQWFRRLSWGLRVVSFILVAALLVSGFLVVPKLVNPSSTPMPPTPTAVHTAAADPNPAYLFKGDFDDPQFDGNLPTYVMIPEGRCAGTKVVQMDGSLTFQTAANIQPDCYVNFSHQPYPLSEVKSVEFTLRSSLDVGDNIPSFAPIFDTTDGGRDILMVICGIGSDSGCVIKASGEGVYQTETFPEKPGERYTYRIEILDPDTMAFRFRVNGELLGEFTLPPELALKWKGTGSKLGCGVVSGEQSPDEIVFYLENFSIEAR